MLVGDSIIRNQWESLVCLVQSVIPAARKTVTYHGPVMAFQALVRKITRFNIVSEQKKKPKIDTYFCLVTGF